MRCCCRWVRKVMLKLAMVGRSSLYTSVAILVRTHECSTIPKSKFHAKTQRRKENRSSLRETTFSGKDGITRIPRNISTRTDLCITADAGAREPLGITSFCKSEHSISSGNSLIHPKYLQLFLNSRILNWQAV